MLIVGLDCATDDTRVGLARGMIQADGVRLDEVLVCGKTRSVVDQLVTWLEPQAGPALLAIDAPLGWPRALGVSLVEHRAGEEIGAAPNDLFRRTTDRFIQQRLGKTPLDVGADRIARTAHSALKILGELRRRLGQSIPLAWSPDGFERIAAIEVYPAATLLCRRFRSAGYKKPAHGAERRELLVSLTSELTVDADSALLERNADALDAAVCVLAGADFLRGRAVPPQDVDDVVSEGWIWAAPHPDVSQQR